MRYNVYDRTVLLHCLYHMFKRLGFLDKFNINPTKLREFLCQICLNYNFTPFHNMTHAFNVTHALYWIFRQEDSFFNKCVFEDTEKLAMLLSAIGHDLNHPGLGNTYFVKAGHDISKAFNQEQVLENFHSYTLFGIFEQTDLLSDMIPEHKEAVLGSAWALILDTDMGVHSTVIEKLESIKDFSKPLEYKEKVKLMSAIIHACDISNPTMKFEEFRTWGLRIIQEFNDLWVAENDLHLKYGTPAPHDFLKWSTYDNFKKGQAFFTKTFVSPIW